MWRWKNPAREEKERTMHAFLQKIVTWAALLACAVSANQADAQWFSGWAIPVEYGYPAVGCPCDPCAPAPAAAVPQSADTRFIHGRGLIGMNVFGPNQELLGTIDDFVIDKQLFGVMSLLIPSLVGHDRRFCDRQAGREPGGLSCHRSPGPRIGGAIRNCALQRIDAPIRSAARDQLVHVEHEFGQSQPLAASCFWPVVHRDRPATLRQRTAVLPARRADRRPAPERRRARGATVAASAGTTAWRGHAAGASAAAIGSYAAGASAAATWRRGAAGEDARECSARELAARRSHAAGEVARSYPA